MLEEAAGNSKLRAERLAKGVGNWVIGVISASQRIFQITEPKSTQTSSWGMYDTSSIEKKVRAVVTMEFSTVLFLPVTHKKKPRDAGLKNWLCANLTQRRWRDWPSVIFFGQPCLSE